MLDAMQVALPLAVLTLIAGGSLVAWVVIFRRAAQAEAKDHQDPNHSGAH
jgi:lipopolysaccharide export LptBFGC system permease protein LptF